MTDLARKFAQIVAMVAWLGCAAQAQYAQFQVYGQEQGLENLDVRGVAADEQGFLWAATGAGLYRWNGARFSHVGAEAGVTEEPIARLSSSSTGHLWVSSERGLFYEDGGKFIRVAVGPFRPNLGARGAVQELGGGEIAYISGDRLISVRPRKTVDGQMDWAVEGFDQSHPGFPASLRVNGLAHTAEALWLGCEIGLCRWRGETLEQFGEEQGIPKDSYNTLLAMRGGDLWARGLKHLLHWSAGTGKWVDSTREIGAANLDCHCPYPFLLDEGRGRLLVNLLHKIAVHDPSGWQTFGEAQGLPSAMVTSASVVGESSVWLGVRGEGLLRWKGLGIWENYTKADGLPSNAIWQLSSDGAGGLLAGTDAGIAYKPAGARHFERLAGTESIRNVVYGAARTADGSFWFSSEVSLYRWRPGGRPIQALKLPGLSPVLKAVGSDLWVGTVRGLYLLHAGDSSPTLERFPGMENAGVRDIAPAGHGELWVSATDGVHRVDPAHESSVLALPNSQDLDVHSLALDRAGVLWGSVDQRGILRMHIEGNQKMTVDWVSRPTLHSRAISQVLVDSRGWVWVSGDGGLDVYHDGRWSPLNERSGLVWNDTNEGSLFEDSDGTIWVGTSGGLSHLVAPEKAVTTRMHTVRILSVSLNGQDLPIASTLRIPPGKGVIEVRVGSTEYESESNVLMRYYAPGYMDGWTNLDENIVRMTQSTPRDATLKFQLFDDSGMPMSNVAMVHLVVQPPWWRGNAALALYVLFSIVLLVLGWRLRTQNLLVRQRHLEQLVSSRTNEIAAKNRALEAIQAELQYKATHDSLTGLQNRSAVLDLLKREMQRCRRENRPLVATILDIDHFKRINDNFGHSAGDDLLVEISSRLSGALREYDASGRYGGEEFILLLPGLEQHEAEQRLNQIREAISSEPFNVEGEFFHVTASFGYAALGHHDTVASLLKRADMALYRAKAEGRDCVRFGAEERSQISPLESSASKDRNL